MAKNNKSVGKKKWIAGGIIGFASVTLIATGFATWVVGNQVTAADGSVNVTVDTAQNNSVELTATLGDNSLTIAEAYDSNKVNDPVHVQNKDAKTPDFAITFSDITVNMGQAYYESHSNFRLEFALAAPSETVATDVTAKNTVDDKADLINQRNGASYTYIDIDSNSKEKSITITPTQDGGNYACTLSDTTINFTWGTFFGGKAPTDYYNGLIKGKNLENNYDNLTKITNELNAMSAAFTNKEGNATLNIKVSLVADSSTVSE